MAARTDLAFVGCRTTRERAARGKGITVLQRNGADWRVGQTLETYDNPSWLVQAGRADRIYALHGDRSSVSSYSCDPVTGALTFLSRVDCGGRNPVHLCATQDGAALLCANYATGSVALLPIDANGEVGVPRQLVELGTAQGPHRVEQSGPHPHQVVVSPGGSAVLIPDKGADRVVIHGIQDGLSSAPVSTWQSRECSGPRHLVFHPVLPLAYVVGELNSTVTLCHWDERQLAFDAREIIPTLPRGFTGDSRAAAIQITPDGRWLFVSNRGHDSVAVIALDAQGRPEMADVLPTGARVPRFMTLCPDGGALWVAHEGSDVITVFALDPGAGLKPEPAAQIATPSPTCLLFAES